MECRGRELTRLCACILFPRRLGDAMRVV
jgi:hypothetical protein